jgi:hypothetical protein
VILKRTSYFSFLPFLLVLTLVTAQYPADRFDWQTLEAGMLKVHWYEGDSNFGQAALETAQMGLKSIESLVQLDLEQPIEIFIYASVDDLHTALVPGEEGWIAGHANPELGVLNVLIETGPRQEIAMEQRIPHELMHVMLYRRIGAGYKMIPAWLREGMATLVEMYPNTDYDRVLRDAVVSGTLIPIRTLCAPFPSDAGQAFLAYAESRSFTRYLYTTYGSAGLLNLAVSYAAGVECERGPQRAFGVSLSSLESQWRSSVLGEKTFFSILQNISPYLALLCLVLMIPMFGIAGTLRKGKRNEPGTSVGK